MAKMTKDSRTIQMALDYIVYMFVGSYFKKAACKTAWQESKLYIRYQELQRDEQYRYEDECIRYIETELLRAIPEYVWDEKMDVILLGKMDSDSTEVIFQNDNYRLKVTSHMERKKPVFTYKLMCGSSY